MWARLTVDSNTKQITNLLNLAAGQFEGSEIPKHQVVIGSVSLELVAMLGELGGESLSVENDLLRVLLERRLRDLEKGGRDSGNGLFGK